VLYELNSATAIDFLETLTGYPGLVPDPHYFGGGQHQIVRGGMLEVHADFNIHPRTSLERRLNLLVYLNQDWPEEYGGALELWPTLSSGPEATIAPLFNRCVVFSTTSSSFHGHPHPLTCPEDRTRKSLALYYYSHPSETARPMHNTIFRGAEPSPEPPAQAQWKQTVARWAPPAALDAARRIRDRRAGR
jgi:Rps23 Pro-64 3,4-dihydroxylase Tpa1-like proline 4-hydroxylase